LVVVAVDLAVSAVVLAVLAPVAAVVRPVTRRSCAVLSFKAWATIFSW